MEDKERNRLLAVLFVGVLMGALDIAIVGPALPAIQQASGSATSHRLGLQRLRALNLISTPLMAKLSDRFGRALYTWT